MIAKRFTDRAIEDLIKNKERENVILDYKSAISLENNLKKKKQISKDVSAFANSGGGHLIYGVREKNHIPMNIDGTDELIKKKEWLEQVINSNIQPRIENIDIYPVQFPSKPDSAVLVVRIPQSYTAHQAKDLKYYHRYGSESLPMEDYQIKQTMNRGREPILLMKNLEITPGFVPSYDLMNKTHIFNFSVINKGLHSAKSCVFEFILPRVFSYHHQGDYEGLKHDEDNVLARIIDKDGGDIIIHPGQEFILSGKDHRNQIGIELNPDYLNINDIFEGEYRFFAENMSPVFGKILFNFSNKQLDISIT